MLDDVSFKTHLKDRQVLQP